MKNKEIVNLSLDRELVKEIDDLWLKEVNNNSSKNMKPISKSQFYEKILRKGLYAEKIGV